MRWRGIFTFYLFTSILFKFLGNKCISFKVVKKSEGVGGRRELREGIGGERDGEGREREGSSS